MTRLVYELDKDFALDVPAQDKIWFKIPVIARATAYFPSIFAFKRMNQPASLVDQKWLEFPTKLLLT